MPNVKPPISYTSRDFNSIKQDLINYAKIYYPNTYKDFNEASFGSMMIDMISYVGDILSFYVDYQTNETLLDSAIEEGSIVKIAKQLGYKFNSTPIAKEAEAFYNSIPEPLRSVLFPNGPDYEKAVFFDTAETENNLDNLLLNLINFDEET